ncbi:MAG TPA: cytochrome c, partial [Vicinamibacterales bacterium]|nr:cytochrome c [Vicinamibacterales bacterium]
MAFHMRHGGTGSALALLSTLLVSSPLIAISAQAPRTQGPPDPKQVYRAACLNCHGPQGKGVPQPTLGFDLPVPDFTDCSFASREPDADWLAVVHDGGPARAFSKLMPAFRGALSVDEMEAALAHVRGFCGDRSWPRGELNLPRPLVTEKAFPEDEAVVSSAITPEGGTSVVNRIVYEKRLGQRNQLELVVPYGFKDAGAAWANGVGDVALGFKRALYHDHRKGTIFSVTGEVVL